MTWAGTYLIKSAVTAGRLAATAEKHGIPLIGDWRYAAKLLRRQATPAGKAHYKKVVGFVTPEEQNLAKNLAGGKDIEVMVTTPTGKGAPSAVRGDANEVSVAPVRGVRRTMHTHPASEGKGPAFRETEFGVPFPSSGLDIGSMPSDALLRTQTALRELGDPTRLNHSRWLDLATAVGEEAEKERFPSNLEEAISTLRKGKHYIPLRVGDYAHLTDRKAAPVNVILAPHLGTQSVSKMKEGPFGAELRRMYFGKTST